MLTIRPVLIAFLALTARATPINSTLTPRAITTFNLHVWNNCKFYKEVGLYQITPDFKSVMITNPTNLKPGDNVVIPADFHAIGMRLSGHVELGPAGEWMPQALFEFGYSKYAGVEGTAYDLSVMQSSDRDIGIGAYPIPNGHGSKHCPSNTCFPWYCPPKEGWTNPDQIGDGSPADTVCYKGKTDFKIVFCP